MRAIINDCLRAAISYSILIGGLLLNGLLQLRLRSFARTRKRLKRRYRLTPDTPIQPYGPQLEHAIEAAAANAPRSAKFAFTSGSSGKPKRILYTKRRLRRLKFTYNDVFARACWAFQIRRTSLYVFSSLQPDDSLTSLLLDEPRLPPPYLATLQAPYRAQRHPAIVALIDEYGAAAVRLWILTIANPGVFYSTNPSTVSTFFDELTNDWRKSSRLIRDWVANQNQFDRDVRRIARRIDSRGSKARLQLIATSDTPVPIESFAPSLQAYICWTGGYVRPFLDRLQKYLPPARYRHIPMCSMSTETLETLSYFQNGEVAFIPLGDAVVHEFIDPSEPRRIKAPSELEPGHSYELIVTDAHGLRRYQTRDLFLCRRKLTNGLPDLAFVRRSGLEYSFTGEKLTAEQMTSVFERLRADYRDLLANRYLTCVPSQPSDDAVPHYKVLLIGDCPNQTNLPHALLATRCDELMMQLNCEYKSKRVSGRLGPVRFMETTVQEFARRLSRHGGWESQFKFLPLWQHTWESGAKTCSHLQSKELMPVP
jgi:GH3 auxin-responsive promoter